MSEIPNSKIVEPEKPKWKNNPEGDIGNLDGKKDALDVVTGNTTTQLGKKVVWKGGIDELKTAFLWENWKFDKSDFENMDISKLFTAFLSIFQWKMWWDEFFWKDEWKEDNEEQIADLENQLSWKWYDKNALLASIWQRESGSNYRAENNVTGFIWKYQYWWARLHDAWLIINKMPKWGDQKIFLADSSNWKKWWNKERFLSTPGKQDELMISYLDSAEKSFMKDSELFLKLWKVVNWVEITIPWYLFATQFWKWHADNFVKNWTRFSDGNANSKVKRTPISSYFKLWNSAIVS